LPASRARTTKRSAREVNRAATYSTMGPGGCDLASPTPVGTSASVDQGASGDIRLPQNSQGPASSP
jgi:hypothetical protein